jgi:hypothetical protein
MQDSELEEAVREFVGAFEVVFDEDWAWGRERMAHSMDRITPADGTFLRPTLDPEHVNWGSRAALLRAYERLTALMRDRGIQPHRPVRDAYFVYSWRTPDQP